MQMPKIYFQNLKIWHYFMKNSYMDAKMHI